VEFSETPGKCDILKAMMLTLSEIENFRNPMNIPGERLILLKCTFCYSESRTKRTFSEVIIGVFVENLKDMSNPKSSKVVKLNCEDFLRDMLYTFRPVDW